MRKGDAQQTGQLDRSNAVAVDAAGNALVVYSVIMWVIITVPVMRSGRCVHSTSDLLRKTYFTVTAPMDLDIACKCRYAVKLWIDG